MNPHRSFYRKIGYFSAIGLLLLPLFWLSQPATTRSEGGKLAQLRKQYNLSQANLGEIDPTSATMKLSTLGLHGIAADLLWNTAINAKEREDWTSFDTALEQITNLQPHFVKVWQFQAHNVSFNISCQFDNYHDRYHYVIKGIKLLERGTRYNDRNPRILCDLGFFLGFKIGKSDEAALYRPMFAHDDDFHKADRMAGTRYEGHPDLRDNWLFSKWWYHWVDRLLDEGLAPYQTLAPAIIHSYAPLAQIQYAEALANEGHFDEDARKQWQRASEDWKTFGHRRLPTDSGNRVFMADFDAQQKLAADLRAQFEKLTALEPGLEDRIKAQRRSALTENEKAVIAKPDRQRSPDERELAYETQQKLLVSAHDLALAMDPKRRDEAVRLADRLESAQRNEVNIDKYRGEVNYKYWVIRCDIESRGETLAARKAIFEGDKAYAAANLTGALDRYTEGMALWKRVIDKYPSLLGENVKGDLSQSGRQQSMVEDLMKIIDKYRRILAQNDRKFPQPFILQIVLDRDAKLKQPQR